VKFAGWTDGKGEGRFGIISYLVGDGPDFGRVPGWRLLGLARPQLALTARTS